jgi:hypothetical protein
MIECKEAFLLHDHSNFDDSNNHIKVNHITINVPISKSKVYWLVERERARILIYYSSIMYQAKLLDSQNLQHNHQGQQCNIKKRHVIIVGRLLLVQEKWEISGPPLLHCDVASALWNSLFTRFSMSWIILRRAIDLLACW